MIWSHPIVRQIAGGINIVMAAWYGGPLLGLSIFCMFMMYEYALRKR